MSTDKSTALVRIEPPASPMITIESAREFVESVGPRGHLMFSLPSHIPPHHQFAIGAQKISAVIEVGQVYNNPVYCKQNERALTKKGILDLLCAAGGSEISADRIDDRREKYVAEFKVVIDVPGAYGRRVQFRASKGVDYRDGSPQIAGMQPKQLIQARQNTADHAEVKALLKACRLALKLKQKYTVEELQWPFYYAHLLFVGDPSNPDHQRMIALRGLGIEEQLYGPRPGSPPTLTTSIRTLEATEVIDVPDESDDVAGAMPDDAADDFGAPPPPKATASVADEKAPILCACACGDQKEITEQVAKLTIERGGAPWCGSCWWWGARFDQAAHRDLGSLGMPKFPKIDGPAAVAANVEYLRGKKGGAK